MIKEFDVDGFNYKFEVGEDKSDTIEVNEGDTVVVNLTSTGGFHDWVCDEVSASTARVSTGNTAIVEFEATPSGEFEFYCSVGSHREQGMVGILIIN